MSAQDDITTLSQAISAAIELYESLLDYGREREAADVTLLLSVWKRRFNTLTFEVYSSIPPASIISLN